jgi:hypothetical protein
MRKILSIALVGAAVAGLGLAAVAQAQDMPAAAVKSGPPSVDWPIQDLLADPITDAVIVKDLPDLPTSQYLDMIKPLSIRSVATFPQANIDAAKLASVQADLTAAAANDPGAADRPPVGGTPAAAAPAAAAAAPAAPAAPAAAPDAAPAAPAPAAPAPAAPAPAAPAPAAPR